ncbi:DUF2156 domain-containing protein [Marinobacter xestospongiae]|uniref:DUF2156 domain-containing protein n=1 Tax=Marinobacter xestospongiae TaxID=994319 RepID=A0ABU3W231_9GAMM|nr:DUF2156 domain-containing protein [Marinobacter xestospongiae]MDV2080608.1 DUF2156 domain-containing protein [Marinobacter xestospongiae]
MTVTHIAATAEPAADVLMPSQPAPASPVRLPSAQLESWLCQHGRQSSSYFSLQQGCRHYSLDSLGFVPYIPVPTLAGPVNVVFTDPVAAPNQLPRLLRQFERSVPGRPLYVGVGPQIADVLAGLGHRTNIIGTEFAVDLERFSLRGRAMKQLRHASNLHRRHAVSVMELPAAGVDQTAVAAISDAWRQGKAVKHRELSLLTRPPVFADEWGVRKFYAYLDGQLAGYVFFDPYFDNGELAGYCANILRARPEAHHSGLLDYIILQAMTRFREEGVRELSLGIAPLHGVRACPGEQPMVRRLAQLFYRHGNRLYAFAPLAYHKSRYRGRETPWYLCARDLGAARIAAVLLRGTGLLGGNWSSNR